MYLNICNMFWFTGIITQETFCGLVFFLFIVVEYKDENHVTINKIFKIIVSIQYFTICINSFINNYLGNTHHTFISKKLCSRVLTFT